MLEVNARENSLIVRTLLEENKVHITNTIPIFEMNTIFLDVGTSKPKKLIFTNKRKQNHFLQDSFIYPYPFIN